MRRQLNTPLAWLALAVAAVLGLAAAGHAQGGAAGQEVDPENILVIDTRHGDIVVTLYPEFAPRHVERVKTLARSGFYDGLTFHRVIDTFMAQGGDPTGTGAGDSDLPNVSAEFTNRVDLAGEAVKIGEIRDGFLTIQGAPFSKISGADIVSAFPVGGGDMSLWRGLVLFHQPTALALMTGDGLVEANVQHCTGAASMARASDPNSANSQFFLMRGPAPWLDRKYSAWGQVVSGQEAVMALAVGEPPAFPDRMRSVRVAADLPAERRPRVSYPQVEAAAVTAQAAELAARLQEAGSRDFQVCTLQPEFVVTPPAVTDDDPLSALRGD